MNHDLSLWERPTSPRGRGDMQWAVHLAERIAYFATATDSSVRNQAD